MTTTVNGISITPDMESVLTEWQTPTFEESTPKRYIGYLNDVQDELSRTLLLDMDRVNVVVDLLTKIILIKDDLKQFIIEKGGGL